MAIETPSRHSFVPDGNTRVFPIPSPIKGDNYCRIEINGVYFTDRSKYDIVNNSIVFIDASDVPSGSELDVLVVQSEEALGELGTVTNIDIVAQDMSNINTVAEDIDNVNTVSNSIDNVNTTATNINNVNTVASDIGSVSTTATNISNVNTVASNIDDVNRISVSADNVDRVADSADNIDTVSVSIDAIDSFATYIDENPSVIEAVANNAVNISKVGWAIDNVNTVASNVADINTVVDNLPEILLSDDNAATATEKASIATIKAQQAATSAYLANSYKELAESYVADLSVQQRNDYYIVATEGQTEIDITVTDTQVVDLFINGIKVVEDEDFIVDVVNQKITVDAPLSAGDSVVVNVLSTIPFSHFGNLEDFEMGYTNSIAGSVNDSDDYGDFDDFETALEDYV